MPVISAMEKLRKVPINTYSVCFRELNGGVVGAAFGAGSGLSINLSNDFAAIKNPIAANWFTKTSVRIISRSIMPIHLPTSFKLSARYNSSDHRLVKKPTQYPTGPRTNRYPVNLNRIL